MYQCANYYAACAVQPISNLTHCQIGTLFHYTATKVTLLPLRKLNALIFLEKCAEYIFLEAKKAIYLQSKKIAIT